MRGMAEDLPLFKQNHGFSCGPASLLMVMGSLDRNLILDGSLEMSLWEDANLGESKATSSYGLALAALKRGFGARVYANGEGIGFVGRLVKHFPRIDAKKMDQHYQRSKSKARELGVEEVEKKVGLEEISTELEKGVNPMILISSRMMGEIIGIPHWVVLTRVSKEEVHLVNPEWATRESYTHKRFLKHLGWGDQTRMVCVFGLE